MKRYPNLNLYLICALIVAMGLYSVGWFYTADQLEETALKVLAQIEKKGHIVHYDRIEVKGFPFQMKGELQNFAISLDRRSTLLLRAEGPLTISTSLWTLPQIRFSAAQPNIISAKANDIRFMQAARIDGTVAVKKDLVTVDLKLADTEGFSVRVKEAGLHLQIEGDVRETLGFDLRGIALNTAVLKNDYAVLDRVQGRLTHAGPSMFKVSFATFLKNLYENDGTIDVAGVSIDWQKMRVMANGTLTFDEALQPVASFSADFQNPEEVPTALESNGLLSKQIASLLRSVLGSMGVQGPSGQRTIQKIAITLQDRELTIGSIPVFRY